MVRLHITFLHFTARNRCGAYNPAPDISFWLVRTKTTVLKIVTLLARTTEENPFARVEMLPTYPWHLLQRPSH